LESDAGTQFQLQITTHTTVRQSQGGRLYVNITCSDGNGKLSQAKANDDN